LVVADFIRKIDPILIQNDPIMQENVLHIMREFPYAPVEWTNRLLQHAIESEDNRIKIITTVGSLPFNEESVKPLLKLTDIVDEPRKFLLVRLVNRLKPESIVKYGETLVQKQLITREYIDYCRFLLEGEEENLWKQYRSFLNQLDHAKQFDPFLFQLTKQLVSIMVEKGVYEPQKVKDHIEQNLEKDWFSFEGIMAIFAAGFLQDESMIPHLAKLLASDDYLVLETVLEALPHFQSEEAVCAVVPYAKNHKHYIFALGVLKQMKNEAAEKALIQCYDDAKADGKIMCIEGLVGHLSSKAFPLIEDFVKNGYQTSVLNAEELFYFFYTLMNQSHPLLPKWKEITVTREEEYLQRSKNEELLFKKNVEKKVKVGRNDPCPCGSGKKYKKCCGK
jgi:hypothetical protein